MTLLGRHSQVSKVNIDTKRHLVMDGIGKVFRPRASEFMPSYGKTPLTLSRFLSARLGPSLPCLSQWCTGSQELIVSLPNSTFSRVVLGSLKSAILGVFTPWKLASATNQRIYPLDSQLNI